MRCDASLQNVEEDKVRERIDAAVERAWLAGQLGTLTPKQRRQSLQAINGVPQHSRRMSLDVNTTWSGYDLPTARRQSVWCAAALRKVLPAALAFASVTSHVQRRCFDDLAFFWRQEAGVGRRVMSADNHELQPVDSEQLSDTASMSSLKQLSAIRYGGREKPLDGSTQLEVAL
jgi:hypothetical protein